MADNLDANPEPPNPSDHPSAAKRIVFNYAKARLERTDTHINFVYDEVYIVWFCFILGGWKALVSTSLPDGRYYEVTYNRPKNEVYLDCYVKVDNVRLPGFSA